MNAINKLTPHMQAYSEEFTDNGNINWLPYLMYFHPFGFSSPVVNRPSWPEAAYLGFFGNNS